MAECKLEIIRRETARQREARLIAGARFLAKHFPNTYELEYTTIKSKYSSKQGPVTLTLLENGRHLIPWPIWWAEGA